MTTSEYSRFGDLPAAEPLSGEDITKAYDQYAQPLDDTEVSDHYYAHGSDIQSPEAYDPARSFQPPVGQEAAYQPDYMYDPAGDTHAGYGYEHGADCDCDAHGGSGGSGGGGDDFGGEEPSESKPPVTRRRFLQGLAVAGTVGFGVVRGAKPVEQQTIESQLAAQSASTATGATAGADGKPVQLQTLAPNVDAGLDNFGVDDSLILNAAPVDQRVLVLIEFQGGNDGLSMVVPYGVGAYYDRRPRLAIPGETVLPIDDQVGLSPELARLHQRQLATVEGVGPVDGVLSHFEMVERWELGDMRGLGGQRAGFLARLSDRLDRGAAVTGLSVAGHTPRFNSSESSTLALNNLNQLRVLTNDDWIFPRYRSAVRSFGGGPLSTVMTESWNKLFDVGDSINSDIDEVDNDSLMIQEGAQLGRQLAMAAEMIKADVGVRVIHASLGGFDTHDGHQGRHAQLMRRFDAAVDGFLQAIDAAGMSDRVLVATTSEFGRRVNENGSGLDHGAASSMLVVGPVKAGRGGDPSPLGDLDGNGNLRTTVPFDRYLATLSQEWLGVEAASILPEAPEPLDLF